MKIGILGGGESGVGAALLAKAKGHIVAVSDSGELNEAHRKELKNNNIRFEEGGHTFEILKSLDLIVKSPGIPNTADIIVQLKEKGVRVIGEIEFGALQISGKIVAITGTNGKTTTTNLTYEMFKNEFSNVAKGGNLGNSFCRLVLEDEYEWYILEVSSFQLEDIVQFRPDIACILNVTPDHLDRYDGSIKKYRAAKARIAMNQTKDDLLFILEDEEIKEALKNAKSKITIIKDDAEKEKVNNPYLRGKHNAKNVAFAKAMSKAAGVSDANIDKAIESFINEKHRLQPVARINEVMYVNDSKATNVDAVYYALTAFEGPIIWIAGGVDKGNDYGMIEREVKDNVKAIIVLGEDKKIGKYFDKKKPIKKAKNMANAIKKATKMADSGDIVLLSPACASFDLFDNYKDRGEQFITEVWRLLEKD